MIRALVLFGCLFGYLGFGVLVGRFCGSADRARAVSEGKADR